MAELEKLYDPLIGQKVGNGQCGALTSDYMRYMTDCKYQWAGEPGNGELPPHTDAISAWNVYTQTDWNAIGFEYINNPRLDQVRADDTFYIAPRPGLPTGHTGLVASVVNGNITTFEQNVLDNQYVQKLPGDNSWSWYGGFDGIVRKKAVPNSPNNNSGNNNNKGDEEEMIKFTIRKDNKGGGTAGYLYNGAFVVGGDTKKYNTIYQKLRMMETAGLIKPIKAEISTAEYDALCEVYPSHRNKK